MSVFLLRLEVRVRSVRRRRRGFCPGRDRAGSGMLVRPPGRQDAASRRREGRRRGTGDHRNQQPRPDPLPPDGHRQAGLTRGPGLTRGLRGWRTQRMVGPAEVPLDEEDQSLAPRVRDKGAL
jgi:hypothetical protein